jgi:hypothetical protein
VTFCAGVFSQTGWSAVLFSAVASGLCEATIDSNSDLGNPSGEGDE